VTVADGSGVVVDVSERDVDEPGIAVRPAFPKGVGTIVSVVEGFAASVDMGVGD